MNNTDTDRLTRDYVHDVERIAFALESIAGSLKRLEGCVGEESASGDTMLWTYDASQRGR